MNNSMLCNLSQFFWANETRKMSLLNHKCECQKDAGRHVIAQVSRMVLFCGLFILFFLNRWNTFVSPWLVQIQHKGKWHNVYCAKIEVETNSYLKQDKLSSTIV